MSINMLNIYLPSLIDLIKQQCMNAEIALINWPIVYMFNEAERP